MTELTWEQLDSIVQVENFTHKLKKICSVQWEKFLGFDEKKLFLSDYAGDDWEFDDDPLLGTTVGRDGKGSLLATEMAQSEARPRNLQGQNRSDVASTSEAFCRAAERSASVGVV